MRHGRATIYISIQFQSSGQPAPPPSTPNVLSSSPRRNARVGLGHELVGLSKRLVFENANVLFSLESPWLMAVVVLMQTSTPFRPWFC